MVNNRLLSVTLAALVLILVGVCLVVPVRGEEPGSIWAGQPSQRMVALTFDDGPSPIYTREILALLQQYHAKATFFVLGEKVEK